MTSAKIFTSNAQGDHLQAGQNGYYEYKVTGQFQDTDSACTVFLKGGPVRTLVGALVCPAFSTVATFPISTEQLAVQALGPITNSTVKIYRTGFPTASGPTVFNAEFKYQ